MTVDAAPDRAGIVTTVVASLFALAIGVATGFITTFTHRGLPPWGLLAGLVVVAALVAGFRLVFASRVIGGAAALGVVAATAVLTLPGAGGIAFVVEDPIGYIWASGPALLSVIVLAWPARSARRAASPSRSRMGG
jgi:hypothetical protein